MRSIMETAESRNEETVQVVGMESTKCIEASKLANPIRKQQHGRNYKYERWCCALGEGKPPVFFHTFLSEAPAPTPYFQAQVE